MRGEAAWEALQTAIQTQRPLCLNDDRFVADELTQGDLIELKETCTLCPLLAACTLYAREGRPQAGFWAGRTRP